MNNRTAKRRRGLIGAVALLLTLVAVWIWNPLPQVDRSTRSTSAPSNVEPRRPMVGFEKADLRVLFIGNSHTSANNMPHLFRRLIEADERQLRCHVAMRVGSPFLAQHASNSQTLTAIRRPGWDVVVLQAQKYSTTGLYSYPDTGAVELTKIARDLGAKVVMFPEWRQRGKIGEGPRIHALHQQIAQKSGADVAPVGLAWDAALERDPKLVLHAVDGNHANADGAYLTACVSYAAITGRSPVGLPTPATTELSAAQVRLLQQAAWDTVTAVQPRNATPDGKPDREPDSAR